MVRKRFWAGGVMDIITMDQHNKWQHFGLWLHLGLDPFCIPLVMQSDPGTENYGVANCHTLMRHALDPSLSDTLQHRWMHTKKNVKVECRWSQICCQFSPGFDMTLDQGLNNDLYNPDDPLERLVFLWLAVPWIQSELDDFIHGFNHTKRRVDKNKILPQVIPELIRSHPEDYDSLNFMRDWAPPDDPVFQLVPPLFHEHACCLYAAMNSPVVLSHNFWLVYLDLLAAFVPTNPVMVEGAEGEEFQIFASFSDEDTSN
ncbi:hypothetical protein DFH29DRAFT_982018 [Suillus ampliporus]|nr:hypothetical protein DFH29DRAFT_982018 [Suillus ampliporus]